MKVSDIFDVRYGHNLEEIRCTRTDDQKGVLFVSRSGRNNGVTSRVLAIPERQPGEAGLLTVACGGTVMSTFVQTEPFYTGRDVYILTPKDPTMSLEERLWWAACLRANAFRYSFGRQVNRTLASIALPDKAPDWAKAAMKSARSELLSAMTDSSKLTSKATTKTPKPATTPTVSDLFIVGRGDQLALNKMKEPTDGGACANFVSRSSRNNGVAARVLQDPNLPPNAAGLLTVACSGSVMSTFVQVEPFYTAYHVHVLTPKDPNMPLEERLWWAACLRANAFRFSFGRQANRTLSSLQLSGEVPEWVATAAKAAAKDEVSAFKEAIKESKVKF